MENESNNRALARGFCACEPPAKIYIFNMEKTNWHLLKMKCKHCGEKIGFCKLETNIIIDYTDNPLTFNREKQI